MNLRIPVRTGACERCDGTGLQLDAIATGKRIRQARRRLGIGLREASRALKLSPTHLSDIELGRRAPSPEALDRIIELLGTEAT